MFSRYLGSSFAQCGKNLICSTSTLQQISRNMETKVKTLDIESFQSVLPKVIDVLGNSDKFNEVPQVKKDVLKILSLNVEGGKKYRGLTTVYAYEMFEKPENITDKSLEHARVLGWCVEMVQAYFLVLDDIIDSSQTRRGAPCWYRQPDVGLRAINDALLIKSSCKETIKLFFQETPIYPKLIETVDEITFFTSMGQHLDLITANNKKDYSQFTTERYNTIVKYKCGYYTFYFPLALGLILSNITDKETHRLIEKIAIKIGQFFQMQDDYIDLYGDPKVTGKVGTDIHEGKCSWLAVTALEHCTPEQREVFNNFYGSKDPAHIEKIKQLYNKLEIRQRYLDHESRQYRIIMKEIEALPPHLSPQLFVTLIDTIFKRQH